MSSLIGIVGWRIPGTMMVAACGELLQVPGDAQVVRAGFHLARLPTNPDCVGLCHAGDDHIAERFARDRQVERDHAVKRQDAHKVHG